MKTKWGWTVWYPQDFIQGENVDIGYGTFIQAEKGVVLCDDVQIGGNCCIYSRSSIDGREGTVIIGPDARVGAGTVVFPNVVIGAGAVVASNSTVNKDIPAGELWGGNPVRFIKSVGE
jgi:acetyltransferase-like isoleucine patch superfamily enzyme